MKNKNSNDVIIEVNGLQIKKNSIYKVTDKLDKSAPTGFIKEGVTKLPSVGIGNTVPCRYIVTNKSNNTGVYDTGFYEESPCYRTLDLEERRQKVKALREHIVEPYEKIYKKGTLDNSNEEFWNSYGSNLYSGRYFMTNNPDDLLELYIAIQGYELTPKDKIGNPRFSESQYCIEDKELVKNIKDERAERMMNAIGNFSALSKSNPTLLVSILKYVKFIPFNQEIDLSTLSSAFFEWLNKSEDNSQLFLKAYDLSQDKKTKEVIDLYILVYELAKKGILGKSSSGQYSYKDQELGADLKTVANNLNSKKDLQDIKIELLEL